MKQKNNGLAAVQRAALGPYGVWALLFIVVPLIFVAYYAFTDNAFRFTTENMTRFFTARSANGTYTYLLIFWRSLKLAVISTIICLLMGYPVAYILSRASARTQKILITLIMIPMWMNFLIRTYAWMTILQDTGILNSLLRTLGLGPLHMIGTEGAVLMGLVYNYLPFMVLPIYTVLKKMDYSVIEAYVLNLEKNLGVKIHSIGYDRYNAISSAQKFEEAGYVTVEIRQHSSVLHPPTKWLSELIENGKVLYEPDKLLEANFQNARCQYDTNMNRYVNKKKSSGKVDEVVALINALYLLQQNVILDTYMDWVVQY